MSIPCSARRSSTLRSDSGYLTYIITTRQITSGELLKYRNGSFIPQNTSARRNQEIALTAPPDHRLVCVGPLRSGSFFERRASRRWTSAQGIRYLLDMILKFSSCESHF